MNLHADTETFSIEVPHLGLTLRSLMGCAATAAKELKPFRRRWKLVYRGAAIGYLQLAHDDSK